VAAGLTVAFDAVMEPVAIALGYWTWTGGAIPLRNYAAWFLISAVLGLPAALGMPQVLRRHAAPGLAAFSTGVQLVFFGILRLTVA
jgi:bisanhydrobacterioruberin hydratase